MKLKNGAEYMESLRQLHPRIYYKGKKIEDVTRHPATAPHVRAAAMTYALASDPEYKDLATTTSHLTGRTISRFTHVHQGIEDLIKKIKLLRVWARRQPPVSSAVWAMTASMPLIRWSMKSIKSTGRTILSGSRNGSLIYRMKTSWWWGP
jgi:hypothetical protein